MNAKSILPATIAVISLLLGARVGFAQGAADNAQRVAALKQSLQHDQANLRHYEWIETTTMSLKGEEKSKKQSRCYYSEDGKLQKVEMNATAAKAPGGLRGRVAANKKEELQEYMQKAAGVVKSYVPPDPARIQAVADSGKMSVHILEPGKRVRLDFKDYRMPGDVLGVEMDLTSNRILAVHVNSYVDTPSDPLTMEVHFATMQDGTGHAAKTVLDVKAKEVKVVTENSGYRKMAQ